MDTCYHIMHETTWNIASVGNQALARHGVSVRRDDLPASCRQNPLFVEFCRPLETGLQKARRSWPKAETGIGTPGPFVSRSKKAAGGHVTAEPIKGGVPHRCLDAEPHTPANRNQIRGAVYPAQYLENFDRVGLELPEASEACAGAGRKGHSQMETLSMAAYKKKPNDLAPILCFLTKAASSWFRTWSVLGRPKGRHRNCDAPVVGERFLPSLPSVFLQNASGWPSTRDFIAAKTSSLRKLPSFFVIFSCISAGLSCCSGIPGCRIGASWSQTLLANTLAFKHFGSQAMRRNSTRMNMCGAILNAQLRIASRRISAILSGLCIRRSRGCDNLRAFCGAVFMHRNCLGVSVSIS